MSQTCMACGVAHGGDVTCEIALGVEIEDQDDWECLDCGCPGPHHCPVTDAP